MKIMTDYTNEVNGTPPLILPNVRGETLDEYKIEGKGTQDGIPSPDNPIEPKFVGDKTKNLFDTSKTKSSNTRAEEVNKIEFSRVNDVYTVNVLTDGSLNGGADLYDYSSRQYLKLEPSKTYTVSVDVIEGEITGAFRLYIYSNGSFHELIRISSLGVFSTTINTDENNYDKFFIASFYCHPNEGNCTATNLKLKIQVEEGTTATAYEPYGYKVIARCRGENLAKVYEGYTTYGGNPTATRISIAQGYSVAVFKVTPNNSYTFKTDNNFNSLRYFLFENDPMNLTEISVTGCYLNNQNFGTFVVPSNCNYAAVLIKTSTSDAGNIMAVEGSYTAETMPSYEPYIQPTETPIYLDEPLRAIYDTTNSKWWSDYVDFKNGNVVRDVFGLNNYINAVYRKMTNNVRFAFHYPSIPQKKMWQMFCPILPNINGVGTDIESACHHNSGTLNSYYSFNWSRLGLTYDGTNVYKIDDPTTPLSDNDLKTIATNYINSFSEEYRTVYMVRETPTTTPITLPSIPTIKGNCILEIVSEVQPTSVSTKYKQSYGNTGKGSWGKIWSRTRNLFNINAFSDVNYYDGVSVYRYKLTNLPKTKLAIKPTLKSGKSAISGFYLTITSTPNPNSEGAIFQHIINKGNTLSVLIDTSTWDNIYISFYPSNLDISQLKETYDIQLEEGSTIPTVYLPYLQRCRIQRPLIFNQLVQNGNFENSDNWITKS